MNRHTYTQSDMAEYIACLKQPMEFMKQSTIRTCQADLKFDPYLYQLHFLNHFHRNALSITKTDRQMGCSTVLCLYALWLASMRAGQKVAMIGPKQYLAWELMDKIRFAQDRLPPHLKVQTTRRNAEQLAFRNGSSIICRTTNPSTLRGYGASTLILDSAAFSNPKVAREFWVSVYPTISCYGTKIIVVSSPGEDDSLFTDLWEKAPHNGFARLGLLWADPDSAGGLDSYRKHHGVLVCEYDSLSCGRNIAGQTQ